MVAAVALLLSLVASNSNHTLRAIRVLGQGPSQIQNNIFFCSITTCCPCVLLFSIRVQIRWEMSFLSTPKIDYLSNLLLPIRVKILGEVKPKQINDKWRFFWENKPKRKHHLLFDIEIHACLISICLHDPFCFKPCRHHALRANKTRSQQRI